MKIKTLLALAGLVLLGGLIWRQGFNAAETPADTLPLLAAFPLYLWLTLPRKWRKEPATRPPVTAWVGLGLLVLGALADWSLLLALGWVAMLDAFQGHFVEKMPRRFLVLPLLGFPWVTQNLASVGWVFRYTGAAAVQAAFTAMGVEVHREGTLLLIRNLPLSVEPACAGLNVLQSMLIVGCLMVCMRVPAGKFFWLCIAALVPLAWIANTARIFMLGCAGLVCGADFARGWFHQWGGWLVLCLMFLLCERLFTLFAARRKLAR
jgi:exosortase